LSSAVAYAGPLVIAALGTVIALSGLAGLNSSRSSAVGSADMAPLHRGPSAAAVATLVVGVAVIVAAIVAWAARQS
jgi:hypothetical protein